MPNDMDDERLLAALGEALRAREAVPDWFTETAKSVYAWHTIDAELAELTYDSGTGDSGIGVAANAAVRSETASVRTLTFSSARLSIELEVADDCLLGQVIPPREGTVEAQTREAQTRAGSASTGSAGTGFASSGLAGTVPGNTASANPVPVDVAGCFSVDPLPVSPFRLRYRTADGVDVVTGWITL